MADEFDLIARYLAPLSGPGGLGLADDVALLADGHAVTKDLLVAGVHFLPDDPLDQVAQKALRVNISDLVAKGCAPVGYVLGLVWPEGAGTEDWARFAMGLKADQAAYGFPLLGGDTTRHRGAGPLTISITMIGRPLGPAPILRSGAQAGDRLLVTGTIGDSGLGLNAALAGGAGDAEILSAYRLPDPPFSLAASIGAHAHGALDVSDGLVADGTHLAKASGVGLCMDLDAIPFSAAGLAHRVNDPEGGARFLLTCGDDYQTLCAVPAGAVAQMQAAAQAAGVRLTDIGVCTSSDPGTVTVRQADGAPLAFSQEGYRHF